MALHCSATLFVARHGDATYGHAPVLSTEGGALTALGRSQVRSLAEGLATQRIARVFSSRMTRAVQSAEIAAEVLGVDHVVVDGLEEIDPGAYTGRSFSDPAWHAILDAWFAGRDDVRVEGAQSGAELFARYRHALESIADAHRGERVLVISHGGVMSLALPRLTVNTDSAAARGRFPPNAVPAQVEIGDDGWWLHSWPGAADPDVV
ncbi:MAG: histidine phosphatase family protein [Tetrasphaera sp.]|nr:histidine phosphatase family protein [Tetrasphaera sp.]